jgi:hypothetical protein
MLTFQCTSKFAYAENQMGYRLLSVQEASTLPHNHGALGMDVERAQQITDEGMTFDLIRVKQVRQGSPGAKAGFRRGDQIIAVDGRVFPSIAAFAAYVGSMSPGSRVSIDYIPAGGGPRVLSAFPWSSGVREGLLKLRAVKRTNLPQAGCPPEPKSASGRQLYWAATRWAASPPIQTQEGQLGILSSSSGSRRADSNNRTSPRS